MRAHRSKQDEARTGRRAGRIPDGDGRPSRRQREGGIEAPGHPSVVIRAADTGGRRSSARILVARRYGWRGYRTNEDEQEPLAHRLTLVATEGEVTLGTISVGFDGPHKLGVDELFPQEADRLRAEGLSVCEFGKLAVDEGEAARRALPSLFHVAYLYAHRLAGVDVVLIEVNPRHVRFYQRMLGFRILSRQKHHPRVDAPAVLLALDCAHASEQILRFGGKGSSAAGERSFYPYVFSPAEEAGLLARLRERSVPDCYRARHSSCRRCLAAPWRRVTDTGVGVPRAPGAPACWRDGLPAGAFASPEREAAVPA